jgi:hypothetical protein
MDDLTAIRGFRSERDTEPPEVRESARRALEARMDAAAAEARSFGEAVAGSQPPVHSPGLRGILGRRRRVLAFAGAIAAAAIVAGTLVLSSGPTAQRASAAEILHEAAAAASHARPNLFPGPGQYFFNTAVRRDVMGWISPVPGLSADKPTASTGGTMQYRDAYNAVVTIKVEQWTAIDGSGRSRETLGGIQFWSKAEEDRWKQAGSPLPPPFNPEYRQRYPVPYRGALEANSHVIDLKHQGYGDTFHFPDTSKLPTDPKALREAVEANAIEVSGFNLIWPQAKNLDAEQTKEELINVLFEGEPTPQLQAAIFNALAELPGIKIVKATDSLGRHGDAIKFAKEGVSQEYIFDPETSDLFASRNLLVHPGASRTFKELPAATTVRESDYLHSGVVDSIREKPGGAKAKG